MMLRFSLPITTRSVSIPDTRRFCTFITHLEVGHETDRSNDSDGIRSNLHPGFRCRPTTDTHEQYDDIP